jgi:hypothetical protein
MSQTATVQAVMEADDLPEALLTATGPTRPLTVDELTQVPTALTTAAKKNGLTLLRAHNVMVPGIELDVDDPQGLVEAAKQSGAKRIYLWAEPLHPRADPVIHARAIEEALRELEDDLDDPEEAEAQQELRTELERVQELLHNHGALLHGAGYLADGIMHQIFIAEEGLLDALMILSSLLEDGGGRDDDTDGELHEMDLDDAAEKIIDHIEDEMDVSERDMRRRANELARQAAHQMVDMDELEPPQRQKVQQAIKEAAVRLRKSA